MSEEEKGTIAMGFASCDKPERYIQALVKHWSHKMATSYSDGMGAFPFSELESAAMQALPGGIGITLTTEEADRNIALRSVLEKHIDRFAFREAPLNYEWKEPEEAN